MSDEPQSIPDTPATQIWVATLMQVVDTNIQNALKLLDSRLDGIERQHAELMMGYADMASTMQSFLMVKLDKEDEEAFLKALDESRKDMLKAFKDGVSEANFSKQRFHPAGEPDSNKSDTED